MPIYEYVCEDCRREFEILVRGEETPRCEACGGDKLKKLLSVPAAHNSAPQAEGCPAQGAGMCGQGCCGLDQCPL